MQLAAAALPERTADEWVKGPPENLRERAAAGFAKKHGVAVDELELRDGFLGLTVPGRALREVLPEQIDRIVRGFSFTKSMRWDESGIRFARPVRWVLAKLDGETIVGETSFGHRFTHGAVEIPTAAAYADALRAADVEPVAEERRRLIVEGLDTIGGWSDPGGKLAEVIACCTACAPNFCHALEIRTDGGFDRACHYCPSSLWAGCLDQAAFEIRATLIRPACCMA